ncbi:conserved hypothetical protein [Talaromyces stipitatus ATCC 10500]|uniref:Uncharacterized protein n=1 Tax=Talaromyces stipitatus (strain ATCC 10500 / CBS 375.48 / QM 6759 / NRRL 1006) TaxID=441959 RepID=B8M8P6_TALSN|nr:uncharacterized protein TSTA_037770 [Talaromyces stipitatus ATCC 10500]EED20559.1 conserved hypothetical protein [Talaromyces stipitatus ATCC 10500]
MKMQSQWSLATKILTKLIISYLVLCGLFYSFEHYYYVLRFRFSDSIKSSEHDYDGPIRINETEIPHVRYDTGFDPGSTTIYGYPRKGGLYTLPHALGVEFDFLGLDRFGLTGSKEEEIKPSDEEEVFCNKMRQLGAKWFPDRRLYCLYSRRPASSKPHGVLHVGWPSNGGVWVLHIGEMEAIFETEPWGIIYNALNMDERCQIIERLGGKFYPDPKRCPYLDLADDPSP